MRIPVIALSWASPALALALSASVQAHEPEKSTSPEAKSPSGATVTMTTAESMIVVRDKQTGKLRRATAEEMEKLIASGRGAQAARPAVEPYSVRSRIPGTRSVALGDWGMSNQVARKNAHGGIDEVCVPDEGVAQAMSTPAAKAKTHE